MPASASIVEECFDDQCTITFGFTGQIEPLTFPANATNVRFEVLGAQGGKSGGGGGKVTGTFLDVPSILFITVGGAGGSNAGEPGGFNGGGNAGGSAGVEGSGGGASDIRIGDSLSSRIVVAGGGGGRGSGLGSGGGAGGGLVGGNGRTGQGAGGLGGSQSAGGFGGASNGPGTSATQGDWGVGGTGGYGPLHGGGGGGGGYYGGGGGGADEDSCCTDAGGGGGGSSYTDDALVNNVIHTQGVRSGAGQVTISYQLILESEPVPPTDEPTTAPSEEPAPPTDEPISSPVDEVSSPSPTEPGPEKTQSPIQDPEPIGMDIAPQPTQEIAIPQAVELAPDEPTTGSFATNNVSAEKQITTPGAKEADEILTPPSKLRQAAQTVVVPTQQKPEPWSANTLFAGLIGLALFALIAGFAVARRGVPGAIAS